MDFRKRLSDHFLGWLNSHGQILFVDNRWLSLLLLLATFVFPYAGLSGLIAVVTGHIVADVMGFDRRLIRSGELGFNVLMTGLVMGSIYQFNIYLVFLLILTGLLAMLVTLWFRSVLLCHQLPYLSLPFLVSTWVLLLSVSQYKTFTLTEVGLFTYNDLAQVGGLFLVDWYQRIQAISIGPFWDVYFKSIGAIFFQYNLLTGVAIAIGLLLFSRISFVFSLVGFTTGYLFYRMVDGNFTELHYSYIGFNFILTSIALGSFYLVPSIYALIVVVLVIPITALFISATGSIFAKFQLPIYSLPFNIAVLMLIVVLRQRWQSDGPQLVMDQQLSPEKNLYTWIARKERLGFLSNLPIHLPIVGEWRVSQGHDGAITHQGNYRHAWDFDLVDDYGKTYGGGGLELSDYYCYSKPVFAPADGEVVQIIDGLPDNRVGESDLEHNWGNTIVIKHADGLYSKLSHLKAGSFTAKQGEHVMKGAQLALVGSSGRSPEPHLHFQLQANPYVGSVTMRYPIAYFTEVASSGIESIRMFDIPKESTTVKPLRPNPALRDAYKWQPGENLSFNVEVNGQSASDVMWTVGVDMENASYIHCPATNSTAWFYHADSMFYFTTFKGDTKSMLYAFFIASQKVVLSLKPETTISDEPNVQQCYRGFWLPIQDVLAPFVRFLRASYTSETRQAEGDSNVGMKIQVHFTAELRLPWKSTPVANGIVEVGQVPNGQSHIIGLDMTWRNRHIKLTRI